MAEQVPEQVLADDEAGAAETILSEAAGRTVRIERAGAIWGRSHVLRLSLADGSTAVLKRYQGRSDATGASSYAVEAASLVLLGGMEPAVAPRLLGEDRDQLLVVMEDLPPGRSLAESFLLGSREEAESALLSYARSLGAMHRFTLGRGRQFDELVRQRAGEAPARCWWLAGVDRARSTLIREAVDLGADPTGLDQDLDQMLAILADPSLEAFVHADACPDNVRVSDGHCRIFDFELSAVGSAALDAGYLLAPFPSCWCFAPLPRDLTAAAVAAYRGALAPEGFPDEELWQASLAAALACYLVARVPGLQGLFERTDNWGTTRGHARLLSWTAGAVAAAEGADLFPALRAVFSKLNQMAADVLGPEGSPHCPALAPTGAVLVDIPDWWQEGL